MRSYRAVYVLRQNLSAEEAQAQVDKIVEYINQNNGEVLNLKNFGLIKMAYQMDRNPRAHYFIMDFKSDPSKIKAMRAMININDNFLREMVTLLDKKSKEIDKINLTPDFKAKEKKHELVVGSSAYLNNLGQFANAYGRILPRHTVGLYSKQMRPLARAIKRSRSLGLMPFKADSFLKV